jgi:hypothetical protein
MVNVESDFTLVIGSIVREHRERDRRTFTLAHYSVYYFTAFVGNSIAELWKMVVSIAVP